MTVRLEVRPGSGTVCRRGHVFGWLGLDVPDGFRDRLLGVLSGAEGPTGRGVVRAVAGMIATAGSAPLGSFGVAAVEGDAVVALLHGATSLVSAGGDRLNAVGSPTWVDAKVPLAGCVAVGPGDPDSVTYTEGGPAEDTDDGLTVGGGFALHVVSEPVLPGTETAPVAAKGDDVTAVAASPQGAGPGGSGPSFEPMPGGYLSTPSMTFGRPRDGGPDETDAPTPPASPPAEAPAERAGLASVDEPPVEPPPPPSGPPQLIGVMCPNGHLNDPRLSQCVVCGWAIAPQPPAPGPRPTLGALVLDDGTRYGLEGAYVVGRAPEVAQGVQAGYEQPITVPDPDHLISRAHFAVRVEDWDVVVADLGSANGTFLWRPGDADWSRLVPHQGVTLIPGSQLAFGRRSLTYDGQRWS